MIFANLAERDDAVLAWHHEIEDDDVIVVLKDLLDGRGTIAGHVDIEVIPLQERIETIGDDADLQEVYDTERHLLYVACTRARDHLLVTGVEPASEFLQDLQLAS